MTLRTAIVGYGNLGRSVEKLIELQPDMELVGIFSRRNSLETEAPVFPVSSAHEYVDRVDVLFLCLGSATDIPEQAPGLARLFTTVDTYDNHSRMPEHYATMDAASREGGNVAVVATGWDPGLFSLNRVIGASMFPAPQVNTFWGKGVSQGHSDAVRRIDGVRKAVQYTIPNPEAIDEAKAGRGAEISGTSAHLRHCFVVADEDDHDRIREAIVTMPAYFEGYETRVDFISEAEFDREHTGMPHGGRVISSGDLGGSRSSIEFGIDLERNPDFTAASQIAYGRAAGRLKAAGRSGAFTVLEVPPYLLSPKPLDELIRESV